MKAVELGPLKLDTEGGNAPRTRVGTAAPTNSSGSNLWSFSHYGHQNVSRVYIHRASLAPLLATCDNGTFPQPMEKHCSPQGAQAHLTALIRASDRKLTHSAAMQMTHPCALDLQS